MNRLFGGFQRVVKSIETAPMSLAGWLFGFVGVVIIRSLLETFSNHNVSGNIASDLTTNVHYLLSYLVTAIAIAILIGYVADVSVFRTAKVVLAALPLIWLAPLVDLLVSGGAHMAYIFDRPLALLFDFFTFFGPLTDPGITVGIRVEVAVMLAIVAMYVFSITRSFPRMLFGIFLAYVAIFLDLASPSFLVLMSTDAGSVSREWWGILGHSLAAFTSFHPAESYALTRAFELVFNMGMMQAWFVALALVVFLFLRIGNPTALRAIIRNIRPARLAHYLALAAIGSLLAHALDPVARVWTLLDDLTLLAGALTLAFAWIFSVTTNDIVDEPIDRISNPDRPLANGMLSRQAMMDVAIGAGILALIGAFALGSYSMYFILAYLFSYAIYSLPPLRLKRVPIVATFLVSLACLSSTMFGFFLISQIRTIDAFPSSIALLIVTAFTLGVTMKDLKDIEGDRAEGIMTIPVIFGERMGRLVIGGLLFVSFMLVPIFLKEPVFVIPCAIAGSILWVGVAKRAGERLIFSVYFATLALLLLLFVYT